MSIDSRPADAQDIGDLLDGVFSAVVHRASLTDLRRGHLQLRASAAAAGPRRRESCGCPLDDEAVLELGDGGEHVEEQLPAGCGGVDALGQDSKPYSALVRAGRVDSVPDAWSMKIRSQPAAPSASVWLPSRWSLVETLA